MRPDLYAPDGLWAPPPSGLTMMGDHRLEVDIASIHPLVMVEGNELPL